MDSKQKVECPVCNRVCKSSEINQHIDGCLKNEDKSVDQDVIFEKSENRNINRKRKSDSPDKNGWGFLKASSVTEKSSVPAAKKNKVNANISSIKNKTKQGNMQKHAEQTDSENKTGQNFHCTKIADTAVSKTIPSKTSVQNSSELNSHSSRNDNNPETIQTNIDPFKPLAEQMRPTCFDDYTGHDKEVGEKTMLGKLLKSDTVPSMVLWGPPGCGKVFTLNPGRFGLSHLGPVLGVGRFGLLSESFQPWVILI